MKNETGQNCLHSPDLSQRISPEATPDDEAELDHFFRLPPLLCSEYTDITLHSTAKKHTLPEELCKLHFCCPYRRALPFCSGASPHWKLPLQPWRRAACNTGWSTSVTGCTAHRPTASYAHQWKPVLSPGFGGASLQPHQENPRTAMSLLSPMLPGITEDGDNTNPHSASQHSWLRIKNADAISLLAGDEQAKCFTQYGYIYPPSSQPFEPYTLSQQRTISASPRLAPRREYRARFGRYITIRKSPRSRHGAVLGKVT